MCELETADILDISIIIYYNLDINAKVIVFNL